MDLRQLHMFVAVAQELNFRRAAERSNVAQPVLSRRIQQLEQQLGVQLFVRTKQSVRLTESGRLFLPFVERSLSELEQGVREVRHAAGVQDKLVVGFVEYANFPFVPSIFARFAQLRPDVRLEQRDLAPHLQLEALSRGELDVAFIGMPAVPNEANFSFVQLAQTAWRVVLPANHELAGYQEVTVAALARERLILFPRFVNPGLYDWTLRCFAKAGVEPHVVQEPTQLHTAVNLVAAGLGVLPSPFYVANLLRPDVAVRPLTGFGPGAVISAAHRKKDVSPVLRDLLAVVCIVAREYSSAEELKVLPRVAQGPGR